MRRKPILLCLLLCAALAGYCVALRAQTNAAIKQQVIATERAFAKTMADRDQAKFARFISAEAVFFSGDNARRGKANIVAAWLKFFKDPQAPFSFALPSPERFADQLLANPRVKLSAP